MTDLPKMTVVILTHDESRHIARAIRSAQPFADQIFVVDSGSSDATVEIARDLGADVLIHSFVNQARQFNWALDQLPKGTDWVFRLDADEIVSDALAAEIASRLPGLANDVDGLTVARRISFLGRPIRHGGLFPAHVLRVFRHGRGRSEDRWMDEHIVVDGRVAALSGELLDDNLNTLGWWIDKHNRYASREALEMLMAKHRGAGAGRMGYKAGVKRKLKESVYYRLPSEIRALVYFLYRFVLRLGFLDGREGAAFHFLQGFWYRYLVDAKLHEVQLYMRRTGADPVTAIRDVLGIDPLR